jgi:saccharopine dehydrogenase (NAD+, L-lysine-forming)
MKRITILGGYGNAGYWTAFYLLRNTEGIELILAGRNYNKAEFACEKLKNEFPNSSIKPMLLDASDQDSLNQAFSQTDLIIVASSTMQYQQQIIDCAIENNIDYFDINLSSKEKITYLKSKEKIIKERNLCFITDGGFHPGVPGALIQYAKNRFDTIETAEIYSAIKIDWKPLDIGKDTAKEMILEFKDYNADIYKDGEWQKSKSMYKKHQFGEPWGKMNTTPMFLEELRTIPEEIKSLKEIGFYVSGFNWFTDSIVFPLIFILLPIFGKTITGFLGAILKWSLYKFSKPPFGLILEVVASGIIDGKPEEKTISLFHEDGYIFTAIPAVACILQYINLEKKPGVFLQANFVEPESFFTDMVNMGVRLTSR